MATTTKTPADIGSVQFAPGDLPAGVTAAQVRSHQMFPAHVHDIRIEEVDPAKEKRLDLRLPEPVDEGIPHMNIAAFGTAFHTAVQSIVAGYTLQVRQAGMLKYTVVWNWSQTPADANEGWSVDRRMHMASVSKFLTAVGMVTALDSKGVSYDAKIGGYLPGYWTKGPKIDRITFRHLLTHRSGFSANGSQSDYRFMKSRVAAGVTPAPGTTYDYENMNFGLCRLLIPIVTGMISMDADFPAFAKDQVWDALTISHYKNYMQSYVFSPAGVADVSFAPAPGSALAYRQPHDNLHGWNSGDLATMAGGAGWRLSVTETLEIMSHVRRKNTIVTPAKAQTILDSGFGIDQIQNTPAGKTYNKNGAWATDDGETEQCVIYFLPEDVEVAALVNSKVGAQGYSLRGIVHDCYVGTLAS
jgi:CubicO group peptidase (beta-lactamase class C family)